MLISEMVGHVVNTRWTKINNFSVTIDFENEAFKKICGWTDVRPEDIDKALIDCTTPQYTNQNINQYVLYEYRYHQGRDEIYRFTMTFRDYDQMKIFNLFRTAYIKSKDQYFDKIKMKIVVYMDDDLGVKKMPIFQTTTAIIENISQLSFSNNTENQIAEFSVSFICNTTEVNGQSIHKDDIITSTKNKL